MPQASSSSYPSLIPLGPHGDKPPIPLNRPVVVVGSHEGARLHLVSRSVSRAHCLLVIEDSGAYVRDLQSRTHTIINGREVHEAVLKAADVLEIGTFKFKFNDVQIKADPISPPPGQLVLTRLPEPILIRSRVILIGRRPGCDLTLDEDAVSTAHAVIYERNGERHIRDLGSRTGTRVNGKSIHDAPLALGDSVRIGDTIIRYEEADVSPEVLAGMSTAAADDLEHLVGTARLGEEPPEEAAPINEVSVRPAKPIQRPLPLARDFDATPTDEIPLPVEPVASEPPLPEPEIDLSHDPDIVGSNDTVELPPIPFDEEPRKPVLSDQVVDHTDNTDITVHARGLSDPGAIAPEISSTASVPVEPEVVAEDVTPLAPEPVESQPPVKAKKGRGWRREAKVEKAEKPPKKKGRKSPEPVAEIPVVEESIAPTPVADEPIAFEPEPQAPAIQEPIELELEPPLAEAPAVEEPLDLEPAAESPAVAEEPIAPEPIAPEPEPVAEEPAIEPEEDPTGKAKAESEETATDSVFRIPDEPDNDTAVLEPEPVAPPRRPGASAKLNLQLSDNLAKWREQAARDLENIDFSKLDLSQREETAEEVASLDLSDEPQTSEAAQEDTRLDLDIVEPTQPEQRFESPLIGPGAIEEPAEPELNLPDETAEVLPATEPEPQSAQSLGAEMDTDDAPTPVIESQATLSDTTFGREMENLSGADTGVPVIEDEAPEEETPETQDTTTTPAPRTPLQAIADMAQNFEREPMELEPEPAQDSYRIVEEDRPIKPVAQEPEVSIPTIEQIIEETPDQTSVLGIDPRDIEEELPAIESVEPAPEAEPSEPQLALEEPPIENLPDVESIPAEPIDFLNVSEPEQVDPLLHTESAEEIENETPAEAPLQFDLTDTRAEPLVATTDASAVVEESELEPEIDESTELPVDESSVLPEIEGQATISPLPEPPVEVEQVLPPQPEVPAKVEEIVQTAPAPEETVESPTLEPAVSTAGIESPVIVPPSTGVFEVPTPAREGVAEEAPPAPMPPAPPPQAAQPSSTKSLFDELFGDAPESSSFLGGMPLQLPDAPSSFGRVNIGFDARPIGTPGTNRPAPVPGSRTFATPRENIIMPPIAPRTAPAPAVPPVAPPAPAPSAPSGVTPVTVSRVPAPDTPDLGQRRREDIGHELDEIDEIIRDEPLRPVKPAEEQEEHAQHEQAEPETPARRAEVQSAFDGLAMGPPPMRTPPRPVFSGNRVRERDLSDAGALTQPGKKKKKGARKPPPDPFTLSQVPDAPEEEIPETESLPTAEPAARLPRPPRGDAPPTQRMTYSAPETPMGVARRRGPSLVKIGLSMALAMICVPIAIYTLIPVEQDIEARMVFKNLSNLPMLEQNRTRVEQRQLLESPGVRSDAEQRLKSRAESLGGTVRAGFLSDPVQYDRALSKMEWQGDLMVIPRTSTDDKGDVLRFQSLVNALYTANQPKIDANRTKRNEVDTMKAALADQQRKIETLQAKIVELRQIGENRPAQATLNALEAEAARLEKAWIDAVTARKELTAEVERLKRPLTETVDPNARDTKAEELKNQLEQAKTDVTAAQGNIQKAMDDIANARDAYSALTGTLKDNEDAAAFAASADKLPDLDAAGRAEQLDKLAAEYAVKMDARLAQLKADDSELRALSTAKDAAEKKYKDALGSGDEETIKSTKAEFDEAFQKHTHREQALSDSLAEARGLPKRVADALAGLDRARQAETAANAQVTAAIKLQAELTSRLEGRDKAFAEEQAQSARQRNLDREKQLEVRAIALGTAEKVEKETEEIFFNKKKEVIGARAAVENERKSQDQLVQRQEEELKARERLKTMSLQLEHKQAELAKTVEPVEPTADNVRLGAKTDLRPTYSLVSVLLIAVVSLSIMYASHRMSTAPAMALPALPPNQPGPRGDEKNKPNPSDDDDATDLIPGK